MELVDVPDSKSGVGNYVPVRPRPSANKNTQIFGYFYLVYRAEARFYTRDINIWMFRKLITLLKAFILVRKKSTAPRLMTLWKIVWVLQELGLALGWGLIFSQENASFQNLRWKILWLWMELLLPGQEYTPDIRLWDKNPKRKNYSKIRVFFIRILKNLQKFTKNSI